MRQFRLPTKPGQRIRARDMQTVLHGLRQSRLASGTAGLDIVQSPAGTSTRYVDPERTRWVFLTGFVGGQPIVRDAVVTATPGKLVPHGPPFRPPMLHGYTEDHFSGFVIDGAPDATSHLCKLIAGALVPHHRWSPAVEPPDAEEICQPCEEAQPVGAAACEGCTDAAPCAECGGSA